MANHVIYIPGIGDHHSYGQKSILKLWRLFGLHPHYLALGWNNKEGFEQKLDRLSGLIKRLEDQGHSVSLVGVSAGASAVLNAFADYPSVSKVICICGKINRPETIGQHYYRANPDFEGSMTRLSSSLASLDQAYRKKIMSIHPWRDGVVPVKDTIIEGAREVTLPGWSHTTGIFFGIVFGASKISKFIKN